MKAIKILGREGKKIDIIPTTNGMNLTEIYDKKFEYLGSILYDKKWKKYVLVDLDDNMQVSLDCLEEAFKMTEEYWNVTTDAHVNTPLSCLHMTSNHFDDYCVNDKGNEYKQKEDKKTIIEVN